MILFTNEYGHSISYDITGRYGGNPNNITVCGQSAGAHLALLALLKNNMIEDFDGEDESADGHTNCDSDHDKKTKKRNTSTSINFRNFYGWCGIYDLFSLRRHLGYFSVKFFIRTPRPAARIIALMIIGHSTYLYLERKTVFPFPDATSTPPTEGNYEKSLLPRHPHFVRVCQNRMVSPLKTVHGNYLLFLLTFHLGHDGF